MKASTQKRNTPPRLLKNGPEGEPTHDEIALRAYSLWEQQGSPQNHEVETWLLAEAQLRQSQNKHGVRA